MKMFVGAHYGIQWADDTTQVRGFNLPSTLGEVFSSFFGSAKDMVAVVSFGSFMGIRGWQPRIIPIRFFFFSFFLFSLISFLRSQRLL